MAKVKVHQAFLWRKTDCQSIGRINIKPSSKGYANDGFFYLEKITTLYGLGAFRYSSNIFTQAFPFLSTFPIDSTQEMTICLKLDSSNSNMKFFRAFYHLVIDFLSQALVLFSYVGEFHKLVVH